MFKSMPKIIMHVFILVEKIDRLILSEIKSSAVEAKDYNFNKKLFLIAFWLTVLNNEIKIFSKIKKEYINFNQSRKKKKDKKENK